MSKSVSARPKWLLARVKCNKDLLIFIENSTQLLTFSSTQVGLRKILSVHNIVKISKVSLNEETIEASPMAKYDYRSISNPNKHNVPNNQ